MSVEQTAAQTAAVSDLASYQQFAQQQQAANNVWSAEQAQKQMDFQREMSNTAHQREVADLKAAGLNPILSVNSGASVPNGASAEPDRSTAANVGAILQQVLQAQSAREVAGMYNAATIQAATIAAQASMYGADTAAETQRRYPNTLEAALVRGVSEAQSGLANLFSGKSSGDVVNTARKILASPAATGVSSVFNSSWFKNLGSKKSTFLSWFNQNKRLLSALPISIVSSLFNSYYRSRSKGKF